MDFDKSKKTLDDMLVFDNENVTIVNKPIGYSVQGGPDPTHNLFSLMAARYRKEMVYISHRLDKPTSGLVVLPKNLKTAQHLGKAFESRVGIEKYYLAVTEGRFSPIQDTRFIRREASSLITSNGQPNTK